MVQLGRALTELEPPVRALVVYNANPAAIAPGPGRGLAGLRRGGRPGRAPPVRALVVYNANPAAIAPDQGRVLAGLRRDDLFTVAIEQFMTDTVAHADVVLPATTQLEHLDLVPSWGSAYVSLNRPAIEPLGECRPESEEVP